LDLLWQTIRDANERPLRIPVPVRHAVSFGAFCGNKSKSLRANISETGLVLLINEE
jgi:hypothetical protein